MLIRNARVWPSAEAVVDVRIAARWLDAFFLGDDLGHADIERHVELHGNRDR